MFLAQRYSAAGVKEGREFRVNTTTYNFQTLPEVASLPVGGGFVVVWSSGSDTDLSDVHGQRFAADGARVGVPIPCQHAHCSTGSFTSRLPRSTMTARWWSGSAAM